MRKSRITITLDAAIVDAVDAVVMLRQARAAQSEPQVNRSTFIEHAILEHLETLGVKPA